MIGSIRIESDRFVVVRFDLDRIGSGIESDRFVNNRIDLYRIGSICI